MQIQIVKPGILTTVQDLGRQQHLSQAVPVSGAMDTLSATIAKKCLGNDDNAAVLEFTFANASFITKTDILIAYAGGGAMLVTDDSKLPANRPLFIPASKTIHLKPVAPGSRCYLAVAGGWDVPEVLGSKSTFLTAGFGGFNGRALKQSDVLSATSSLTITSRQLIDLLSGDDINCPAWSVNSEYFLQISKKTIRVISGNEFNWFDDESISSFFSTPYAIGLQSNRMGYQLDGIVIKRTNHSELLSTAVTPGTIQVTNNGGLIMLMADCQTTGGYTRIAQVAAVDLALCGQLKPGDKIYFEAISRREAEKLYIEQQQQLIQLTTAIQCKL